MGGGRGVKIFQVLLNCVVECTSLKYLLKSVLSSKFCCFTVVKYCDDMEGRVKPLLVKKEPLSEADMEKFGKKDPEAYPFYLIYSLFSLSHSLTHSLTVVRSLTAHCLTEVERFIEMNTEKITENKYLCPLSGKKFKGPEFVKKHIFNKHMEKVDAVKQEVSESDQHNYTKKWHNMYKI